MKYAIVIVLLTAAPVSAQDWFQRRSFKAEYRDELRVARISGRYCWAQAVAWSEAERLAANQQVWRDYQRALSDPPTPLPYTATANPRDPTPPLWIP